jgi:hypothetical protein
MKYLLIILLMAGTLGNNKYSLIFIDGDILNFEVLSADTQLKEEEWSECKDMTYDKYEKVLKNESNEYIGKLEDSYYLKFSSKNDLIKTLPNEVVLFRGMHEQSMHPFLILDKKDIAKVKSGFTLHEFELHRKEGTFNECFFYKLSDGRVLTVAKEGNDGELFRNTDDLLAYYSFIEGFDFKIVIGMKK